MIVDSIGEGPIVVSIGDMDNALNTVKGSPQQEDPLSSRRDLNVSVPPSSDRKIISPPENRGEFELKSVLSPIQKPVQQLRRPKIKAKVTKTEGAQEKLNKR